MAVSFRTAPDKVPGHQALLACVSFVLTTGLAEGHRDKNIAFYWLTSKGPYFSYLLSVP